MKQFKRNALVFSFTVLIAFSFLFIKADANNDNFTIYPSNKEEATTLIKNTAGTFERDYYGWCGQYTHDLLVANGIIEQSSGSYNGKDWYSAYKNNSERNKLCENWTYECFDGKESIYKILEKYNGKVYNLVLSMESSTSEFGHVFLVNAIIDNTVYFSESFSSSAFKANQKELAVMSIDDFIDYYFTKDYFNMSAGGIIHFYEKDFYKPIISFGGEKANV